MATVPTLLCGFTRGELAQLLKDSRINHTVPQLFSDYFFTTSPPRHLLHLCVNDDLVRCVECGCTISEHSPTGHVHSPATEEEKQQAALQLLQEVFAAGTKIFGAVHASSDKLSDLVKSREWAADLKRESHECVVCGWNGNEETGRQGYPGETARGHRVSIAHIIPSAKQCDELRLPFDRSNFLPLCGARDEVPSCHSAFDRHLLCFVKMAGTGHHKWTIHASANVYANFDGKTVDLASFKPHRRALHSHTYTCLITGQIEPLSFNVADLDTTPPDANDDPAPPVAWDEK